MNAILLNALDLGSADVVATATGASPGKRNWTVLTLYATPGYGAGEYIAEIVGETAVEGQVRRVRRCGFPTLAKALSWGAFDFGSSLYEELRMGVIAWLERPEKRAALPAGESMPALFDRLERPAVARIGFTAPPKNRLAAAISWLYEGINDGPALLGDLATSFANDFGIDRDFVQFALEHERGEPMPGTPYPGTLEWIDVFLATLRFFDRDAFEANRATADAA